ncbi:MAG: hypothetical protein IJL73_07330 [Lachnospiraceae bacterium]|nr:hypothetical protein [Lachnospiraceae bacterium]
MPYIPEQGHPEKPSMELGKIRQGILTAVETAVKETK